MTATKQPRRMALTPQFTDSENTSASAMSAEPSATPPVAKRVTKQSRVLELLHQDGGASLAVIVAATGWVPHTARAALTGLRKQGHAIARDKDADETRYAIGPVTGV